MDKHLHISITTGAVLKIMLLGALAWLLVTLHHILLIVLTAVVIASAVEPAATTLMRYKVPRVIAILSIYVFFFGLFLGFIYFFIPPILSETATLISTFPSYVQGLQNTSLEGAVSSVDAAFAVPQILAEVTDALQNFSTNTFSAASAIFGGALSFILIIVFSFYFAVSSTGIDDFLRIVTPKKNQRYVLDLWKRSQHKIGLWMQGQLLLGVIVGLLVYLGLVILGVPYALVLGILAGLFELIPVFGPIISSVPGIAIAFTTGGLPLALMVLALYVIIQQFENHLIYPLVVTKVVGVPPLLVILALIIGAQLAGFLGIILSVPMAAAIQEFLSDLQKRRGFVFGELDE